MALATEQIAFELERFRWSAPDRLEVTGRWFGVRGLRFVRPELIVEVGDGSRRLVAVLEHKPWAAGEGEEWIAAFAWRGDQAEVGPAALSVGPTVRVDLPAPGGTAPARRMAASRTLAKPAPETRAPEVAATTELLRLNQTLAAAREERDEAQRERGEEQGRAERLQAELAAARAEHERALAELAAERDAALADRDTATLAETAARSALETAELARDEALRERDEAAKARAAAEARLQRAEHDAREAAAARDAAPPPRPTVDLTATRSAREAAEARTAAPSALASAPTTRASVATVATPRLLHDPAQRAGIAIWIPRLIALSLVAGLLAALLLILGAL